MAHIEPLLHKDACIQVRIALDGLADQADFFTWYPTTGWCAHPPDDRDASGMLLKILDKQTVFGLEEDPAIPWPAQGKLRVEGTITTPLFCTMAKNGRGVVANRQALCKEQTDEVLEPECETS